MLISSGPDELLILLASLLAFLTCNVLSCTDVASSYKCACLIFYLYYILYVMVLFYVKVHLLLPMYGLHNICVPWSL